MTENLAARVLWLEKNVRPFDMDCMTIQEAEQALAVAEQHIENLEANVQGLIAQDLKRQVEIEELRKQLCGVLDANRAQGTVIRELQKALAKQNERIERMECGGITVIDKEEE